MFVNFYSIAAVAVGAGLISAQSIPSVSPGCRSALTGFMASPDAACLNPSALLSFAINPPTTSIVGTIGNWMTGICSSAPCSNQTLASVITNITNGCSAEYSTAVGSHQITVPQVIQMVQEYYPVVREVACLKDSKSNQLCVVESLQDIQGLVGNLSPSNVNNIIPQVTSMTSIPTNLLCTDCSKEAYNIVAMDLPGLVSQVNLPSLLGGVCGANFTDGSTPPDVFLPWQPAWFAYFDYDYGY